MDGEKECAIQPLLASQHGSDTPAAAPPGTPAARPALRTPAAPIHVPISSRHPGPFAGEYELLQLRVRGSVMRPVAERGRPRGAACSRRLRRSMRATPAAKAAPAPAAAPPPHAPHATVGREGVLCGEVCEVRGVKARASVEGAKSRSRRSKSIPSRYWEGSNVRQRCAYRSDLGPPRAQPIGRGSSSAQGSSAPVAPPPPSV